MNKLDVIELTKNITAKWENVPIADINNHVVRISVLQQDFHWHKHTKSDELFYVVEGQLFVDFEDKTEVLTEKQMIKVPKNVMHRTRSNVRTTILCFETKDNDVSGDK